MQLPLRDKAIVAIRDATRKEVNGLGECQVLGWFGTENGFVKPKAAYKIFGCKEWPTDAIVFRLPFYDICRCFCLEDRRVLAMFCIPQ
jgi:hypothetical protein